MLLWKVILWKPFSTTASRFLQLRSTQPLVKFLINTCLRSDFHCSILSKLSDFSLCRKQCAARIKPKSLLMIPQSLQFILFCVQKMIFYQFLGRISKRLFRSMTLCTSLMRRKSWPKKMLIGVLFSALKLLQKSDRSTENGITFPDPVKNQSAFPVTINITVFLMSSITVINFWTRTIYGIWLQQLLCHSTILMIDSLCPISIPNEQLINLEQTHIRCSLHCERWIVKGRDCASALHFFNEITYQTEDWTKQLLRLKSWVISGNPEQWMEFRRLWWTVFVFKCSCLLQLFDFYCLFEQYLLFFLKFTFFCSLSLMTLSEK